MHPDLLAAEARNHRAELLAAAARAREAKQVRRPAPGALRARTGHALVRLGERLADL